ncbi:MAG: adenosine deaminase family protein [Pseudonocardiaceae bacterium]
MSKLLLAAMVAVLFPLSAGCATLVADAPSKAAGVDRYLDSIRDDPERRLAFLRELPKGGDLHNHLSGSVATETLIRFAVEDGLCIDTVSFVASPSPCGTNQRSVGDTSIDQDFFTQVLKAWSMEDFAGPESGHDHFFAAFGKFGAAAEDKGEMLADVAQRAAAQHEFYLETMITPQSSAARALAEQVGYDADLGRMRTRMLEGGAIDRIVTAASAATDADLARFGTVLNCDTPQADPACTLPIRFISQVNRLSAPEVVFAQLLLNMELAKHDPRYVGINFVAPEDAPVALRDYRLHMQMIGYLHELYPEVGITLHAGELVTGLAPLEDLRFHIRDAITTAQAERIGHGVGVGDEDNPADLLRRMAAEHILVEIALTSNRQILEVSGKQHPFMLYRAYGVPVALVTDDEGIERTDLTQQYEQAVTIYGLSYQDLKTMARASLDHSFLQGASLWRAPDDFHAAPPCAGDQLGQSQPSQECRQLLDASPKATVQWRQEAAFTQFEDRYQG